MRLYWAVHKCPGIYLTAVENSKTPEILSQESVDDIIIMTTSLSSSKGIYKEVKSAAKQLVIQTEQRTETNYQH
jgi:hypothetical protein